VNCRADGLKRLLADAETFTAPVTSQSV